MVNTAQHITSVLEHFWQDVEIEVSIPRVIHIDKELFLKGKIA